MIQEYIVSSIIPRGGELTALHMDMLGCRCQVIELEPGKRCLLRCALRSLADGEPPHRISTSLVSDMDELDGGARLAIHTANTTYILYKLGGSN